MNTDNSPDKIVYFYHRVVNKNTYLIPRLLSSLLQIPFFKQLYFSSPGIDEAITKERNGDSLSVEITPSALGVFKSDWQLKPKAVERLKSIGVNYVSFHAPYVNDGVVHQSGRQSYLDNIFDITEDTSLNLFCLISHFQLMEALTPKETPKVLVIHPLPNSPDKSEIEIIKSTAKLLKKVSPLLKDSNIYIGLENMPWLKKKHERYTRYLGSISFFQKLMNEINDPNIGLTFDWGHANSYARYMYDHKLMDGKIEFTSEYLQTFEFEKAFLRSLEQKIFHLHLHYNIAHMVNRKGPWYARNFDYHGDLTQMLDEEYPDFKECIDIVKDSPALKSMVLESVPSIFGMRSRISKYQSSVEMLRSMVK